MAEVNWGDNCWVTTIFLVNSDKQVLLTWNKRLQTWIPVGGHIELGENPEEAILREVKEETGFGFEFVPKPETIGGVKVLKPIKVQIEQIPNHSEHINVIFAGKCTSFSAKEGTDENEKLRWFSKEELDSIGEGMLESVKSTALESIRLCSQEMQ